MASPLFRRSKISRPHSEQHTILRPIGLRRGRLQPRDGRVMHDFLKPPISTHLLELAVVFHFLPPVGA